MPLSPATSVRSGYPLALTGATAATRYVGGTSSGAPASGTFAVGDFVIDRTGALYICTVAGTPGTWVSVTAPGAEVAYTEFTSNVNVTATVEASADVIVTAGAFTADGTSAYLVEFFSGLCRPDNTVLGRTLTVWLFQDGSSVGQLLAIQTNVITTVNFDVPALLHRRLIPASGSRTYSFRATVSAGTGVVAGGAGGAGNRVPGFIRVTKAT